MRSEVMTTRTLSNRARVFACVVTMGLTAVVSAQKPELSGGRPMLEPTVTGLPYSAEAITTVKLTMFDGNKIERSVTARLYRDSAGRIRREQAVVGLETLDPGNDVRAVVTIVDPVAGVIYTLIPGSKTAHRLAIAGWESATFFNTTPTSFVDLGSKDIDGMKAVGRREIITIPAGKAGNEKPIDIVDERWESTELKVLLQSRHSDPRTGVVEYRLTKISRAEASPDLFKVPAGYTIVDSPTR
jgi:hypothetical protein